MHAFLGKWKPKEMHRFLDQIQMQLNIRPGGSHQLNSWNSSPFDFLTKSHGIQDLERWLDSNMDWYCLVLVIACSVLFLQEFRLLIFIGNRHCKPGSDMFCFWQFVLIAHERQLSSIASREANNRANCFQVLMFFSSYNFIIPLSKRTRLNWDSSHQCIARTIPPRNTWYDTWSYQRNTLALF